MVEKGTIVTIQREGQKVLGVFFEKRGVQFAVFKTNLESSGDNIERLQNMGLDEIFKYPLLLINEAEFIESGIVAEKAKGEIQTLMNFREKIKKLSFEELQVEAQEILSEGETAKYNLIIEECTRRHP